MREAEQDVPRTDDLEDIGLLHDALEWAGFTADGIRSVLATDITSGRDALELPLYLRLLDGSGHSGRR